MNLAGVAVAGKTILLHCYSPGLQRICQLAVIAQAGHFILSAQLADGFHVFDKSIRAHLRYF